MNFFFAKVMSERFIDFMDRCKSNLKVFNLTAINTDVILIQAVNDFESGLLGFFIILGMPSQRWPELESYMSKEVERKIEEGGFDAQENHSIVLFDEYGKSHNYLVSKDVVELFQELLEMCKELGIDIPNPISLTELLIRKGHPLIKKACRMFNIRFRDMKSFFVIEV